MNIIPLFDRILVEPIEEQISSTGIYIPANSTERSHIMKVVATGDGRMDTGEQIEITVKPGDTVLVAKYAGSEVITNDKKYFILKQCDILAKTVLL